VTDQSPPRRAARSDRETFHLTPAPVWQGQTAAPVYQPESFAAEGFIHTTHGEANLLEVANVYYRDDPRPFVVIVVDLDRVGAPVRYEDPDRRYPHLHGPLNREAVVAVRRAIRAADGSFVGIE
jgi:uncharacterized protein (DUF952 family)